MHINNTSIKKIPPSEISYYQIKIIEKSKTRKNWNKGLAEIQYVYNQQNQAKTISQNLLFYTDTNTIKLISEGDILLVSCKVSQIKNKGNPGEFNSTLYWESKRTSLLTFFDYTDFSILKNKPPGLKESIQKSLNKTLHQYLPKNQVGLAKALFLGDKSSLSTETTNAFSAAGGMHLLAISGLHIGLMIVVLLNFFRFFSRIISRYQATMIVLLFIWIYAYLIGFPPSVVRSVFMFSLITMGSLIGSQNNQINLLCFSAIILLLINPWYLFDIGFQLSYLAMAGILLTYSSIRLFIPFKNKIVRFLWNGTALGLSAQIFTVPLCLYYFHQFPNYFALTNLGIILISGVLISLGASLFFFSWSPLLCIGIGTVLSLLLYTLVYFVHWIEHLPGSVAKGFDFSTVDLTLFYIIIISVLLLVFLRKYYVLKYLIIAATLAGIAYHRYENLNQKHLIIFNNNKLSLAIHTGNHIYFFYDDTSQNEYKYHRLLEAYERCYPGEIELFSIKDKNIELLIDKEKLSITHLKDQMEVLFDGKTYKIEYDNKCKPNPNINQIGMPWVKGLNTTLNKSLIIPF